MGSVLQDEQPHTRLLPLLSLPPFLPSCCPLTLTCRAPEATWTSAPRWRAPAAAPAPPPEATWWAPITQGIKLVQPSTPAPARSHHPRGAAKPTSHPGGATSRPRGAKAAAFPLSCCCSTTPRAAACRTTLSATAAGGSSSSGHARPLPLTSLLPLLKRHWPACVCCARCCRTAAHFALAAGGAQALADADEEAAVVVPKDAARHTGRHAARQASRQAGKAGTAGQGSSAHAVSTGLHPTDTRTETHTHTAASLAAPCLYTHTCRMFRAQGSPLQTRGYRQTATQHQSLCPTEPL